MITYSLICEGDHRFDGWFRSANDFDEQVARGDVTCPVCLSTSVDKAVMAPAINRTEAGRMPFATGHPDHTELRKALIALRKKVTSEADYVGDRFAEEARKIHFGEADRRGIYGEATRDEVMGLAEDGVDFLPLPSLPEDAN